MSKVLVECISQYRMRYVVEVPDGKEDWALDTVTMEDAEEFSQLHVGETILSHRVISNEEYLKLFDQDNDYLKDWTDEQKYRFITKVADDGEVVEGTEAGWKRRAEAAPITYPTDCV